ncbi:MAG: uracil-DNA glycosylase [Candidatus Bathyarchaeia archaeon]
MEAVSKCRRCPLYKIRRKAVPGEGPTSTTIMLIGEAPGRREDEEGRPFIGPAGRILDELLNQAGLSREQVYISNVVKCIPLTADGKVRTPNRLEIDACSPYLDAQMKIIHPRIVVTLGGTATKHVFEKLGIQAGDVSKVHGRVFQTRRFQVMPTYHPAACLYNPKLLVEMKRDFAALSKILSNSPAP